MGNKKPFELRDEKQLKWTLTTKYNKLLLEYCENLKETIGLQIAVKVLRNKNKVLRRQLNERLQNTRRKLH